MKIVGFDDGPEEGIRIDSHSDGSSSCVVLSSEEVMTLRTSVPYQEVVALTDEALGDVIDEEGDDD